MTKAQVTKAVGGELWVKVNPSDLKLTFRLSEPENNVLYEKLTPAKVTRVINAVFNSNNPKDYSYILTTLTSGRREHQGVRFNNGLHEVLLGIVKTKKVAAELRSEHTPKGKTGGGKKNTRKGGRRRNTRRNSSQTTAPASGGSDDTLAEIKAMMQEMVAKLS